MNGNCSDENVLKWHGTEIVVISFMLVLGIVGNMFVVYIYQCRKVSSPTSLIKRMLASVDLISLMFGYSPFLVIRFEQKSTSFHGICVFHMYLLGSCYICSTFVLLIVAVDSYRRLCLLQNAGINSTRSKQLFALGIAIAFFINIPSLWLYTPGIVFHKSDLSCGVRCQIINGNTGIVLIIWISLAGIILIASSAILLRLYIRIAKTLLNQSKKHDQLKRGTLMRPHSVVLDDENSKMMRRSGIIFIVVTIIFFASFYPAFIVLIVNIVYQHFWEDISPQITALADVARLSPMLHHVTNPIIYSFLSKSFQMELKNMLTFMASEPRDLTSRLYASP